MNINRKNIKIKDFESIYGLLQENLTVPKWQRDYVIDKTNASTFLQEDLQSLEDDSERYFYDAILYTSGKKRYLADALQRLSTEGVLLVTLLKVASEQNIKTTLEYPNLTFEDITMQNQWDSFLHPEKPYAKSFSASHFKNISGIFYKELSRLSPLEIKKLLNNFSTKKFITTKTVPDEDIAFDMFNQLNNASATLSKEHAVYSLFSKTISLKEFSSKLEDFLLKENGKKQKKNKKIQLFKLIRAYSIYKSSTEKLDYRKDAMINFTRKHVIKNKSTLEKFKKFVETYNNVYINSNALFYINSVSTESGIIVNPILLRACSGKYKTTAEFNQDTDFLRYVVAPLFQIATVIKRKSIVQTAPHQTLIHDICQQIREDESTKDISQTITVFLEKHSLYKMSKKEMEELALDCDDSFSYAAKLLHADLKNPGVIINRTCFQKEHILSQKVSHEAIVSGTIVDPEERKKASRTFASVKIISSSPTNFNAKASNKPLSEKESVYKAAHVPAIDSKINSIPKLKGKETLKFYQDNSLKQIATYMKDIPFSAYLFA